MTVKLFARAKDLAGAASVAVTVERPATALKLRKALCAQYPNLAVLGNSLLIAVNQSYALANAPIDDLSEVAAFPPVSGG